MSVYRTLHTSAFFICSAGVMMRSAFSSRPGCLFQRRVVRACAMLSAVCLAFAPGLASGQAKDNPVELSPVPSKSNINATLKTLQELYAEQYKNRSPKARQEFAKSLLTVADEDNQLLTRYVLYAEALRISEELGDCQTAWRAIGRISKQFEIDEIHARVELLTAVGKKNRDPDAAYHITLLAQPRIELLVANDQFPSAIKLTKALESVAKRSRNRPLARELASSQKEMERLAKLHAGLRPAYNKLKENPDDQRGNESLGNFYFFEKGDYQKGVPFLAKGNDPQLAAIAQQELESKRSSTAGSKDLLAVADGWWDLAESVDDKSRQAPLRSHAVALYVQLANRLAGIDKVRVQKRINAQFSLQDDFFGVVWEFPWRTQDDWIGVQFRKDGKLSYTIKDTQESKTADWQATAEGLFVRPSQKRYFIFKLDSQGNLVGEKYEPKQFREMVAGVRANQ